MAHNPPPPHCTPDIQSLDNSSVADETSADWSGCARNRNDAQQFSRPPPS